MDQYTLNAIDISRKTTNNYSTSFSLGVRMLDKSYRGPVYSIYGFVRFADEIVDTFHDHDQEKIFREFREDTWAAIHNRISSNPILQSFQWVVNNYHIDHDLITSFLESMEMDLYNTEYSKHKFEKYIFGSAEVVGLMCLRVFTERNNGYTDLVPFARKLGEAFQKVNFLRDMRSDFIERGRSYFPGTDFHRFDNETKKRIEEDIKKDFDESLKGIRMLDPKARFGVYLAYKYYLALYRKIRKTDASNIVDHRYRVADWKKLLILISSYLRHKLNLV